MAKKKMKSKAKQPVKPSIPETISSEVIAAAYSSIPQPVLMKVCRLCEGKDGPFLNIFDADKVTAKKIDELMPFGIAENDDLPHKICFRCSAKLEELYEFIQKCIKTQENLRSAIGKTGPFILKTKTRTVWEKKLNQTNMSNDDICDALIKKAMEGIKDIPIKELPVEEEPPLPAKRVTRRTDPTALKKESTSDDNDDVNLKNVKLALEKIDSKLPSNKPAKSNNIEVKPPIQNQNAQNVNLEQNNKQRGKDKVKNNTSVNSLSFDYVEEKKSSDTDEELKKEEVKEKVVKPFNIMDHISKIKVNGVGVLFQCKLCNRNFLIKEVVESHNCAKNGIPKVEIPKTAPAPEPPKVNTVKYIKIDEDMKKTLSLKSFKIENDKSPSTDTKISKHQDNSPSKDDSKKQEDKIQSAPKVKPKPKAGPASKTRRSEPDSNPGSSQAEIVPQESQPSNSQSPSVHIPSVPNLNGRYKLVPGPHNIFTLVEDSTPASYPTSVKENQKSGKKRKSEPEVVSPVETKPKDRKKDNAKSKSPEVIDLEDKQQPYPVGLFQTVGHSARLYDPPNTTPPTPFTTPAMKKQSYTIVQTGNPSKLLISTKALDPPVEVPKKRQRRSKTEVKEDSDPKQPFTVTLEDVAHPKDAGFFTFINVDPLLQPSYVLPTDNIIQESQISTSTSILRNAPENNKESKDKDKYTCNMCGEAFSREKKLLAHIQSHYSKMDEEDQMRAEKGTKKRGKK